MTTVRLAIVAVLLTAITSAVWWLRQDAAEDVTRAIERANTGLRDKADAAEQRVLTCPPDLWDVRTKTCATRP
jgi:hypothetical protein